MARPRTLLLLALAAAAVAWAYGSSSPARTAASRARAAQAGRPLPPVFDLEVRADRLDGRAARTTQPDAQRNPFRFGDEVRASRDPQPARPMTSEIVAPTTSALPVLSLVGIADQTVEGKPLRIAVISTPDGLVYAAAGQAVGTRYEVASVGADAVELKDLTDGSTRRLMLK